MRTTDGAQSKGMWNVAWSVTQTECLRACLSPSMVQGSKSRVEGLFAPIMLYQTVC